jgi:LPXTG-motif cell wall-anchored protein
MKLRKTLCLALSVLLLIALAIPAFAVNDSITVNNAKEGETYNLYKLFDLVVDSDTNPTKYAYTVNSDWTAFFKAAGADPATDPAGPGNAYVTIEDGYVTNISDAAALAAAAAAWSGKPAATQTKPCASGATTVEFTGLADGYWLITSTLGTLAMTETTPDASAVEVNEKNPEDTISKEVKEDSTNTYGESNGVQVGDTVDFKSTLTLQPGTRNVKVHDTMEEGLDFVAGSIHVYTDAACTTALAAANYEILATPDTGDTFTIQIKDSYINTLTAATTLYITYQATVNEKAINGTTINPLTNETDVSFGDNTHSTSDTTETTTYSFKVFKHATSSTDNLAGAIFQLKKAGTALNLVKIDDTHYRVATAAEVTAAGTPKSFNAGDTISNGDVVSDFITVASGNITILGVDSDDDYTLNELKAPDGYNKLPSEVDVTVGSDNATVASVENKTGTELPSTGGIGTTIFYIVGALLVVGAGVVLFTRKRMKGEQ